jgi:hypothetical protein
MRRAGSEVRGRTGTGDHGIVSSRHLIWAVALAIVAAICASSPGRASALTSDSATAPPVVPVSAIKAAMLKAATAHTRGSATFDGSTAKATLSGIARFTSGEYDETGRSGAYTIENRVIGRVVYTRLNAQPWCQATVADYPAITLDEVVFSVTPPNAKPVRIGKATVAGIATTHYRLSPKDGPTVNYWIDAKDRIIQMKWESDDGEHDNENFYNYGASVPKISAPSHAAKC